MKSLAQLPGVQHLPTFQFFDAQQQPVRCELMVHAAAGWAVATEQPGAGSTGGGPLVQGAARLAVKVCEQFAIAPEALTLFAHYAYAGGYESVYAVHFAHGDRDLFDGIRFLDASRDLLNPAQVEELVVLLQAGQAPAHAWRAL